MANFILWDNDGVLVDTEVLYYQCNRDFYRPLGLELTEQQFFQCFLLDNIGAWHLLPQPLTEAEIAPLRLERNQRYAAMLSELCIASVPGMAALFAQLKPRYQHGIVTSAHRQHFELIHRHSNLLPYFQFVLTGDEVQQGKPHPEPYLRGLAQSGRQSQQVIVVEDSPRGLQAAIAAGLRCVVLKHSFCRHYDFAGAWQVVETVSQLQQCLMDAD